MASAGEGVCLDARSNDSRQLVEAVCLDFQAGHEGAQLDGITADLERQYHDEAEDAVAPLGSEAAAWRRY